MSGIRHSVSDLVARAERSLVPRALCVFALLLPGQTLAGQAARGSAIDTMALRAHARFLSHDSLGGRANGSHGQRIAADYIIGHLRRLGLEPMGANGDYRQAVPLTRVTLPREDARLILGHDRGAWTFSAPSFHHLGGDSSSFRSFDAPAIHLGTLGRDAMGRLEALRPRG